MEEKVLTLADIGVTTLHIGYNEDRSKAVIEINRVDKDWETLSKLETLKDNFKFRPTGQKSLYEIEEITVYEHFYRLHCIKVEERDKPVKEAMPKYVINIETLFGRFSNTCSFDGLIYECELNDKTNEALSLLHKNKYSVLLAVSGYAIVYRAVRADLDSEEKKIKVYLFSYASYAKIREEVTWLHSLEDLKAIGDESKVPWDAGMLTYKREDAMPKPDVEYRPYGECVLTGAHLKKTIERTQKAVDKHARTATSVNDISDTLAMSMGFKSELIGKLCSRSDDSTPTTKRINIVKLNKVTRL